MANATFTPTIISRQEAIQQKLPRFFTGVPCSQNHRAERYTSGSECIKCKLESGKRRFIKNPEKFRKRSIKSLTKPSCRFVNLLSHARRRAEQKGLEFEPKLIEQLKSNPPTHCACCNRQINFAMQKGHRWDSPSLDRIDNTKGYSLSNTKVLCWRCNNVKNQGTAQEHEQIAAYMRRHGVS